MKKTLLLFAAILMFGCSSGDSGETGGTAFWFDGIQFGLTSAAIQETTTPILLVVNGESYTRSLVTVNGEYGLNNSNITFELLYKTGTSVEGIYPIYGENSGIRFEDFLSDNERACGTTGSMGIMFSSLQGDIIHAINPTGSVKLIRNSATKYTVKYDGNFRLYDGEGDFVRDVPTEINITGIVNQ